MRPLISDLTTSTRLDGLERFIESYLGPRQSEFGATDADLNSIGVPPPLERFLRFAGRWPGQDPKSPYENRFCTQDIFCGIHAREYAPSFELMDKRLIFARENQDVWVAATEQFGDDPPVWISEDSSHWENIRIWRRLKKPLSHFLVSFVLQELILGSTFLSTVIDVSGIFKKAGLVVEPVWISGEYAWDFANPSYFLVEGCVLVRACGEEADSKGWYGCESEEGAELLRSLGLSTKL